MRDKRISYRLQKKDYFVKGFYSYEDNSKKENNH